MKLYLFDKSNSLIGYVEDSKLYDVQGNFKKEVKETDTIKSLINILLRRPFVV